MLADDLLNLCQLMLTKAAIVRQFNGPKPKLRIASRMSDVNVRRLPILQAIEEEPIATNSQ
jgi:hypothetical protein